MSKPSRRLHSFDAWIHAALVGATAMTLGGCVVQGEVQSPGGYAEQGYAGPVNGDDGYVDSGTVEYQASEPPPPLPDYDQPPCPEDGYLWTPGYWGWAGGDYYWVPGTWVQPPQVGVLWTPGYWAFIGGSYRFHRGYWGPHVGFYGGVNYGFGYTGSGFYGGAWQGGRFSYNRAVTNVNVTIVHNTYNTTVVNNYRGNRASYNGGTGGIAAAPTSQQRQWGHEPHVAPTPMQQQHSRQAQQDPDLFARSNGGRPAVAATPRAAAFNAPGVIGARGAGIPQRGFQPERPQGPGNAMPDNQPQRNFSQQPGFQPRTTPAAPDSQAQRNFQQPQGGLPGSRTPPQPDTQGQRNFQPSPGFQPRGATQADDSGQRNFPQRPGFQPRANPPPPQTPAQRNFQPPPRNQTQPGNAPTPQPRPQNHAERPAQQAAPDRDEKRDHDHRRKDDQNGR